ncbi:MAG: DNA-binding protein WhiA [Christensenellaceae bacterium]|jgi:DNA-binding protein WhiA|nr:DNA-binding protein WhiA [Christensenellaceae bacterium]
MSIALIIKNEIIDGHFHKECCKKAFLSGVMRGVGNLKLTKDGFGIIIQHPSKKLIEKCASIITSLTGCCADIVEKNKHQSLGERQVFELRLNENTSDGLLNSIGITKGGVILNDTTPADLFKKDCCRKSYLQGIFVTVGTLTISGENDDSKSSGYLLEITLTDDVIATAILAMMEEVKIHAKLRIKKNHAVIYIKDSQTISDFCAYIEAGEGYFALQNVIISRDCKNNITRKVNWEMANLDRSLTASQKQLEAIITLESTIGLKNLEEPLREVARARLENPSANMSELLTKVANAPSKSGLIHRMRKLIEMADDTNH